MALTNLIPTINKIQSQPNWQDRRRFLKIVSLWSKLVGESVAKQTRPTGIYRNILQVAVSSSAWSQALVFERIRIVSKLQPLLGSEMEPIVDIHFSTAKWSSPPKAITESPKSETLQPLPEILIQHPSYIAPTPKKSTKDHATQLNIPPSNPLEAFERLRSLVKDQTANMPKCPRCRCASPLGELKRWGICSTCVRRDF